MTLTWQNGRQLATLTKDGATSSYSYDINGTRTKKIYTTLAGSVTTEYYYINGMLLGFSRSDGIDFKPLLDVNGTMYGLAVCENGQTRSYYFVNNAQGDVIGLYSYISGSVVATYDYDAWGNCTVKAVVADDNGHAVTDLNHIANLNPFRYRGYYYDTETGLYYLGSRYYDPEVGRWISPEPNVDVGEFDEGAGLIGYNVYAYCANNPVNMIDITGEFAISITAYFFGAVIVSACVAMIAVVNTPSFQRSWERMCNGIAGAFSGALSWAAAQAKSIAQSIGDSFSRARSKPHYRTPREVHHIVAQAARQMHQGQDRY